MSLYDDASLIMYPSGYKSGKIYSQKPTDGSGDLTFTRASTATRVNSSGLIESVASGVPRIDFLNGCGQLLLEPQRTNLVTYSEDFSNASWTKQNASITPNVATSPDGTTNSDKLVENTNTSRHTNFATFNGGYANQYSCSVFVKKEERRYISIALLTFGITSNFRAIFDVENGTVTDSFADTANGATISTSIANYGNGWYRCVIYGTLASSGSGDMFLQVSLSDRATYAGGSMDSIYPTYVGDGTSGLYLYGAQMELGSYPTSYIPTAGSTVTRVADNPSLSGLQTNGIFGATQGTIILDMTWNQLNYIFDLKDASNTRLRIFNSSGTDFWIRDLIGASWYITGFTHVAGERTKIGITWDGTTIWAFQNGVKAASSKTFTSSMAINEWQTGSYLGETRLVYMAATVLSDAEIIELTTL